jgi:hypothetical protein
MEHDAWFFIGVFVFIFLIWIATGGPLRPIPISTPEFPTVSIESGPRTQIGLPRAPYNVGGVDMPGSGYADPSPSYGSPEIPRLSGVIFGPPSPYRNSVSLATYVSNASSSNPSNEYVQLSLSPNAGTPVSITGWQFVSEATGKAAVIPRGTAIPTSGIVNAQQPIVLSPGERAIITTGRSPIGTSFRENICTGYFETFQDFSPSLPQNCPSPRDELEKYYQGTYIRDASCLDFVNRQSRCQAVLFPPRTLSQACRTFVLEHLNYNGCVRSHQNDPDFNGATWRIYLGLNKHLWRDRYEVVKLWDSERRTVDAFSY